MKNIKGILLDKDGTLLDFNSLWIPVAAALAEELIKDFNLEKNSDIKEELLNAMGVKAGVVDPLEALACGTAYDVADALRRVIADKEIDRNMVTTINSIVESKFNRLVNEKRSLIKPIGDLEKLFSEIKKRGIYIGLATSDTYVSAKLCLETLKIVQYFDFIGADDGETISKPDPYLLQKFCYTYGISPEETAVVGDTEVDMCFAKNGNAGLAIAVLSGTNTKQTLSCAADIVLNSVQEIINIDGSFVWCE